MPGSLLASTAPLPLKIHCHGKYLPDHQQAGQRCPNRRPIAWIIAGQPIVRDNGREHGVTWTRCPECHTVRQFAGNVPEEVGGSSGVIIEGEVRGARPPA